ncbi:MAG: T9SS type A sorting domain-containing protein [Flavobacterium sp.]|nr:T9SS type A sorting domain-containing protein [Flavobacterium sp.]
MKRKLLVFTTLFYMLTAVGQTNLSGFFPSNNNSGANFGTKTALHDNTYVVSSGFFFTNPGKVFVFSKVNQVITQEAVLYPSDAVISDQFGQSIAVFGDYIAVGSAFHDEGFTDAGAVYIYKKVDNVWTFTQKITAFDAAEGDNFGSHVKIQGTSLFISAPNNQNSNSSGSVYVYSFNGTSWTYQQKLNVGLTSEFGRKFEIQGNLLVAIDSSDNLHTFTFNTTWTYIDSNYNIGNLQTLTKDFILDNERIYVTSVNGFNQSESSVLIYNRVNNNWVNESVLDVSFNDFVLGKIAVSGSNMIVGYEQYLLQTERKFPVKYYKKVSNNWILQTTLYGEGAFANDDEFGKSLSIQDAEILIGAPDEGIAISTGKAYAYNLNLLNVSAFEKNSIRVYPNPTVDKILFDNQSLNQVILCELYSSSGKVITVSSDNSSFISLENVYSGVYFLKITLDNGTFEIHKIIKN